MECFFKRLEKYIKVRPTAALMDVIVKIMVEVLSILGIVTKEVAQGKLSMSSAFLYLQQFTFVQRAFLRSWPGTRMSKMRSIASTG